MKELSIDIPRCDGCRACEIACVIEHTPGKLLCAAVRASPRSPARLHIERVEGQNIPVTCRQCVEAACADACIAGANYHNPERGTVDHDDDRCVGCWSCLMVCPFGVIERTYLTRTLEDSPQRHREHRAKTVGTPVNADERGHAAGVSQPTSASICVNPRPNSVPLRDPCVSVVPSEAVAAKCDLCPERQIPACVAACAPGALRFGQVEDFSQATRQGPVAAIGFVWEPGQGGPGWGMGRR